MNGNIHLIIGVTTVILGDGKNPVRQRVGQDLEQLSVQAVPRLEYCGFKGGNCVVGTIISVNFPYQQSPKNLYGIGIWGASRPVHNVNLVLLKECLGGSAHVYRAGVAFFALLDSAEMVANSSGALPDNSGSSSEW